MIEYWYAFHGVLGALAYILVNKVGSEQKIEHKTNTSKFKEWGRRLGIGAIVGYTVFLFGLPDGATAFALGYVGDHALDSVINKKAFINAKEVKENNE